MSPITTATPGPPLEEDVFCRCGYNLRGLAPDGRCPECAESIHRALEDTRAPVSQREARSVMWACGFLAVALLFMHQQVFSFGLPGGWTIAIILMTAASWLLRFAERQPDRFSGDAVQLIALRAVCSLWLALALLPWIIGIDEPLRHRFRFPWLLLPVAALHLVFFGLSRWNRRLGHGALAWTFRVWSWLLPVLLLSTGLLAADRSLVSFALLRYLQLRDVALLALPSLFWISGFLVGATWFASLLAAGERSAGPRAAGCGGGT